MNLRDLRRRRKSTASSIDIWSRRSLRLCLLAISLAFSATDPSLTIAADPASSRETPKGDIELSWPLGRSGKEQRQLRIPWSYGFLSAAAESMNKDMYPEGVPEQTDQVHKELLLIALWPDFSPDIQDVKKEMLARDGGRSMRALLYSGAREDFNGRHYDALQFSLDQAVDWSTHRLCITPMEAASTRAQAKAGCYKRSAPDTKTPQFGLDRIGVDFEKYPEMPNAARSQIAANDIFYERSSAGDLETVILCTAEERNPEPDVMPFNVFPQCQEKFVHTNLNAIVSISYRRTYLSDWRAIKSSWKRLLDKSLPAAR